jgi:DNA-binding XRE family transcriptional regulator
MSDLLPSALVRSHDDANSEPARGGATEFRPAIEKISGMNRAEGASIEFTNAMLTRMRQLDVSRSQLASRIGVNPAYISKILRGDTNFSLETMVKIANALDSEFRCQLQPVRPAAATLRRFDGYRTNRRKAA